ncbi:MAG TPA: SDR family oxidoreductase [Tepidisphaeraceae bacterium]|jgi:hypothetical protein
MFVEASNFGSVNGALLWFLENLVAVPPKKKLVKVISRLLSQNRRLIFYSYFDDSEYVGDTVLYARWRSGCEQLLEWLSPHVPRWEDLLKDIRGYRAGLKEVSGRLQGLRDAIDHDMLGSIEDAVLASAFGDLIEQAEHLLSRGYFLASGVVGRALLEEHLRKGCQRLVCVPVRPDGRQPTMSDFYNALHQQKAFTNLERRHVEALAAVGNDAAHNKPGLKASDVERFLRELRPFLTEHPLS